MLGEVEIEKKNTKHIPKERSFAWDRRELDILEFTGTLFL